MVACHDLDPTAEMRALLKQRPKSSMLAHKYYTELLHLQRRLIALQDHVAEQGLRVVVLFEGRDSAGKGGAFKRITQHLDPRVCRTVALNAPTPFEETQWFFQRYVPFLPGAGEIVLFDRSWYTCVAAPLPLPLSACLMCQRKKTGAAAWRV